MEHLRARLPQYCPSFPDEGEGEDNMDITMACGGHITTHIPVVPDFFRPGAKQLLEKPSTNTSRNIVR